MMKAAALAEFIGAELTGDPEKELLAPAPIDQSGPDNITFLRDVRYKSLLHKTHAGAVITSRNLMDTSLPVSVWLIVNEPYAAFALAVSAFYPVTMPDFSGQSHYIAPSAQVKTALPLGYGAYVGNHSVVDVDTVIYPQVFIGNQVSIGKNCILYPGVKVMDGSIIGNDCILHPGAVIGGDGFGFAPLPDGTYRKIPQMGKVILEDQVEVGANTCIDRATLGETIIRKGTKMDNLVQIGHNVEIGAHGVIASQTGFAGSSKIGHHIRVGGQAGFAPHITVAPFTQVNAQSGVAKSVQKEKTTITGSPAEPFTEYYRKQVLLKKLQEELKALKDSIHLLEQDVRTKD
jgi:UDP-3-O-[3-hydroxymyristoyl] glucosamine N-acyltransferase